MATFTLAANPIDWDADNNASLSASSLDLYKKLLEEKVTTFNRTCIVVEARVEDFDNPTTEAFFSLRDDKLVLDGFKSESDIDTDEIEYITAIANEWYHLGGKARMEELRVGNGLAE